MAIYQFIIELIPSAWVEKNKNFAIKLLFDGDKYNTSIAWQPRKPSKPFELVFSKILLQKKAWHQNLRIYGNEESNDIQIWLENEKIESIKIRFDLREDIENLKKNIVNYSKKLSCDFLVPNTKEILKPDFDALNKIILNSSAARFVDDPEKFLCELKRQI